MNRTFDPALRADRSTPFTYPEVDANFSGVAGVANAAARVYQVTSQADMLSLNPAPKQNDMCWRSDQLTMYSLTGSDPTTLGDWTNVAVSSPQLAATGAGQGAELVGVKQAWAGAVAGNQKRKNSENNSIWDGMTPTQSSAAANKTTTSADAATTTAIFNAAVLGAKRIYLPAGLYYLDAAELQDGTEIYGDGPSTIIRQTDISPSKMIYVNKNNGGTSNPADNKKGIYIHDLRFEGNVTTLGFSEFVHLFNVVAVSDLNFERCEFIGWQGDAVYVGCDLGGASFAERHNQRITFRDCLFDGVNQENRQSVSCEDIDSLLFDNCTFQNCTNPTMPGAVDFEPDVHDTGRPDALWFILKNIKFRDCKFKNVGGNVGAVALLCNYDLTTPPDNIVLENCSFENCAYGPTFIYGTGAQTTNNYWIVLRDCRISGASGFSAHMEKINGALFDNVTWIDCPTTTGVWLDSNSNVVFRSCLWNNAVMDGSGAILFNNKNTDVHFFDCDWVDCGVTAGFGVQFVSGMYSAAITFDNCRFRSPKGTMLYAIYGAGHHFLPATNRFAGCYVDSQLGNTFQADESDMLINSYTPVATGASSPGSGTYTTQFGEYRRMGKDVYFRAQLEMSAHSGTGQLQVSLPIQASQGSPTNALYPISTMVNGGASTGGQIGAINPLADSGSVRGSLRVFYTGTGSVAQMSVPSGASSVYIQGVYTASLPSAVFQGHASGTTLTLDSDAYGHFVTGLLLFGPGITPGPTINSLASGTLGKAGSTYTLSSSPGTISSEQMFAN